MAKYLKKICMLLMVSVMVLGNTHVLAKEENKESEYIQSRTEVINDMAKTMTNPERTGDINIDYLKESIAHYEGTINMCKNYLKYSDDKDTKKIAEDIIKDETTSIENMRKTMENLKQDTKNDKEKEVIYIKQYNLIFKNTMCKFQKEKTTKNVDKDFLQEVIIQHECSMKMNDLVNKTSENEEIKSLATKESEIQGEQIEKIKKCIENIK